MKMLSGYRALDLTTSRGYVCGRILADLGADVIKIEPPGGDSGRMKAPFYGGKAHPDRSIFWFAYNLGKRAITLNLKDLEGREIFKKLIQKADFIIESFPTGYMETLGLDYDAVQKINSRIIYTSISPFGHGGPYGNFRGTDIVAMAMGGFMHLTGDPDRPPLRVSFPVAFNMLASTQAALGTMIAFHHRQRTGAGQHVDTSAQASVAATLGFVLPLWELNKVLARRVGSAWFRSSGDTATQQRVIWLCRDGAVAFMAMGGMSGAQSNRALVKWIDDEQMADDFLRSIDWDKFDPRNVTQEFHQKVEERIGRFFMKHSKKELHEGAHRRGIHLQMVSTFKDIMESEQLEARHFWVDVSHPELKTTLKYPGPFIKASETPVTLERRAPLIGEHNKDIYHDELGISTTELENLAKRGVI
ncbi:MAG: CoA transferase [Dehalococcoidia bacterium]|nr:CoA transferase [Dehalococcoidia bacterium]